MSAAPAPGVSADTPARRPVPAAVAEALARPVPAFLQAVAGRPRPSPTAADVELRTERWPDAADVQALLSRLSAFVRGPGAASLFGDGDEAPRAFYGPPRLGTRPASPADPEADVEAGLVGYVCALTGEPFELPAGAPVPVLWYGATDGGAVCHEVHPALAEAGPAHVLWAAWAGLDDDLSRLVMGLADVVDLAAALAGVEPEDLGQDGPGSG